MRSRREEAFASWSNSTYRLILLAYPDSFRRAFGESMAQVFSDAVRDAWKRTGPGGIAVLWMRTIADVARSLVSAYAGEARDGILRAAAVLLILYVCALAGTVGYGAHRFDEFYEPPAFSRFGAPHAHEDELLAAHEVAMAGEFGAYRTFTVAAGFALAALLGVTSALFGLSQRSIPHGAAALGAGLALTIAAFALLPTIWFPLDRYPAGALWLMGGGIPLAAATWMAVTLLGRVGFVRTRFEHP